MEAQRLNIYVTAGDELSGSLDAELATSKSLPALHTKKKKLLIRPKGVVVPLTDREEVERLSEWSAIKHDASVEALTGAEVTNLYRGRFSDLDKIVAKRKGKSLFPPLGFGRSEEEIKSALDITQKRAIKIEKNLEAKEQTRYSKLYEEELVATADDLKSQLSFLESERENCRITNTTLRAKLFQGQLFLRHKSPSPGFLPKDLIKIAMCQSMTSRNSRLKLSPRVSAGMIIEENSKKEFEDNREVYMKDIEENSMRAREIDDKVKDVKKVIKEVEKTQVHHYLELLAEGRDTRSEGLCWVIKALWSLNQPVTPDCFPPFLDLQTIQVILSLSEKSKEYESLRSISLMQERRQRRASVTARAHPDKWNDVTTRLRNLGQKLKTKEVEMKRNSLEDKQIFIAKIEERMAEEKAMQERRKMERDGKVQALIAKNKGLEKRLNQLKLSIESEKAAEMQRIIHECCFNNLEQKLGATMKEILSALLGIDVINRQMSTIAKKYQNLMGDQDMTKTYRFGKGKKVE